MNSPLESSTSGSTSRAAMLLNFFGFQVGWFACVLGAAYGSWWFGPLIVCLLFLVHIRIRTDWKIDLYILLIAIAIGFLGDSLLALVGVIRFQANPFPTWLSPPWMVMLWANFALTLRSSLQWLNGRYVLGGLMGLVSGPLAYLAGERLGAIQFSLDLSTTVLILAIFWGLATPLLLLVASKGEAQWK